MKTILLLFCLFLLSNYSQAQLLNQQAAREDIEEVRDILKRNSSYYTSHSQDIDQKLKILEAELPEEIETDLFRFKIQHILGLIGDRHFWMKTNRKRWKKGLPFIVAPLNNKIVALKKTPGNSSQYSLYQPHYPYLKAIENIPLENFIEEITYRDHWAPQAARQHRATKLLTRIEEQFYKTGRSFPEKISFTFTNGKKDRTILLKPDTTQIYWQNICSNKQEIQKTYQEEKYNSFYRLIDNKIGYIRIPRMVRKEIYPEYFRELTRKMEEFQDTEALIFDLRDNGGGTRDILMTLAPYLIPQKSSPWIANIAKIRSSQILNEDINSMEERHLYISHSKHFNPEEQKLIQEFLRTFTTEWKYPQNEYSGEFVMLLHHNPKLFYGKPVYLLINEVVFSAASVFTTAFKGVPGIYIAGVNSDGSSGRSIPFKLKNSGTEFQISTMISFQRNGKTLDTNGTEPDLPIPMDLQQVLGKRDTQLEILVKHISDQLK